MEKVGFVAPRSIADSIDRDTPVRSESRSKVRPSDFLASFIIFPISGVAACVFILNIQYIRFFFTGC